MQLSNIERKQRKSIQANITGLIFTETDFIEAVEWTNGEGWDVSWTVNNESNSISLHEDEFEAIKTIINLIQNTDV